MSPPRFVRAFLASITGLAVACTTLSVAMHAQAVDAVRQPALETAISQARAIVEQDFAPKVPGVSVAVAVAGKVVWSEGFGFTDLAAKQPPTATTRFRIGSISKSLTSVGLALLVERGQLDLDAPVQKYVPDYPDQGVVITSRQLAGHLAGIRHYRGNEILLNRPFPNVRAGLTIFENDPLLSPPGTAYHYSTFGYSVLSAVMESAAHEEFLSYMEKNVLQPLALTHTRADRKGAPDPERTKFYRSDAKGAYVVEPEVDNSYKWAAGGYLSTPEDLVRFGSALLQPGLLKAETLRLLFTPQKTADGKSTTYGIGWEVGRDRSGHVVYYHFGGSIGGTSILLLHPATKTVVALVCNHRINPFSRGRVEAIAELFAPVTGERIR